MLTWDADGLFDCPVLLPLSLCSDIDDDHRPHRSTLSNVVEINLLLFVVVTLQSLKQKPPSIIKKRSAIQHLGSTHVSK